MSGKAGGNKGNPAAHRMGNATRKARRASSYLRGENRKVERQEAARTAQRRNAALRAQGLPTPWEVAKAERALRRAAQRANRQALDQ